MILVSTNDVIASGIINVPAGDIAAVTVQAAINELDTEKAPKATPVFTTNITTPLVIGGTAVGSNITYKSTTGAGTATGIAHQWVGGTDGATVIATMLNNGNGGIGTTNPATKLVVGDITGQNTFRVNGLNTANNSPVVSLLRSGGAEWTMSVFGSNATDFSIGVNPINYQDVNLATTAKLTISNSGNVGIGAIVFGTSAAKVLGIGSGTAPTTSPADMAQIWVADTNGVAGTAAVHMRTEGGTQHVFGDNVGFGTTSPTSPVEIKSTTTPHLTLRQPSTGQGGARINLVAASNGAGTRRTWQLGTDLNSVGDFNINRSVVEDGAPTITVVNVTVVDNIGFNTTTFGTSAAKVLGIGSGTAPTTSPADMAQISVVDRNGVAGKASLHIRNEDDTASYCLGPLYGEAYFYTTSAASATLFPIDTQDIYHAIVLATTAGSCKGFTHKVGQANAIASVAENSAGVSMKITTTGNHNLIAGECVTHTGFSTKTAYRGKYVVQSTPSATEYIVLGTYTGSDTGFMKRGFSLRADTGSAGVYRVAYSCSANAETNTTELKVEVNKNITDVDNIACQRYFSTAGQAGNFTSSGLLTVADGNYIWLSAKNKTDASDFSIYHLNLNITKL